MPRLADFDPDRQTRPAHRQAAKHAKEVIKGWIGRTVQTVVLAGPAGVGKTHLAKAAALEGRYTGTNGYRVTWYLTGQAFERLVMNFQMPREERMVELDRLGRVGGLVLDDLGMATNSRAEMIARLEGVLDERWERRLDTIVTTNALESELRAIIGERAADRLLANAEIVKMPGESMRGKL